MIAVTQLVASSDCEVETWVVTEANKIGSRAAQAVVVVAGSLTLLASFGTWGMCPTTPCGGSLQSISEYSGLDLGFGLVTALAGLALTVIGLASLRGDGVSRDAGPIGLLALLIVVMAVASVIWMYVIPGDDKAFHWPPFTAILVGIAGLSALAASLWLGREAPPRGKRR